MAAAGTRRVDYHSYILRLWRDGGAHGDEDGLWYISLEDPHSARRIGFRSVAELAAWLTRHTSDAAVREDGL